MVNLNLDFLKSIKFLSPVRNSVTKLGKKLKPNLFDKRVLTQLTLSELASLQQNLSKNNLRESLERFSRLVRSYFKTFLRLHKELTLEELVAIIPSKRSVNSLRGDVILFLNKLQEIEYAGHDVNARGLNELFDEFSDLVKKLASEKS